MTRHKQAIILRTDIKMSDGKKIAQACHASLESLEKADNDTIQEWKQQGQKKVVLQVGSEQELTDLRRKVDRNGLPSHLVTDAGETELEPGTITCLAIGPAPSQAVDTVTGDLESL